MADVEQQIAAEGAEIIWVLEQDTQGDPGTPEACRGFKQYHGTAGGWGVGDDQTLPFAGTFDESPFSQGRGFDIIVPRSSMEIVYTTNHGTPAGNENLSGEEVLDAVREAAAALDESSE